VPLCCLTAQRASVLPHSTTCLCAASQHNHLGQLVRRCCYHMQLPHDLPAQHQATPSSQHTLLCALPTDRAGAGGWWLPQAQLSSVLLDQP
jgi:hypothetical protein